MSDDLKRYKEHLQSQILTEGWESVFDAERIKEWTSSNNAELAELAGNNGLHPREVADSIKNSVEAFRADTKFEEPQSHLIFEPILELIETAAGEAGLKPTRPIEIASSTNVGPSPFALPTSGTHMLFIGMGTSHFCNCWAKVVSFAQHGLGKADEKHQEPTINNLRRSEKRDATSIRLASRLALWYGMNETTLGFDRIKLPPPLLPLRAQILEAMELFAVAHEYSHFIAYERFPGYDGPLSPEESRELEFFCDEMGFRLSREAANSSDNLFGFVGVGAVIFLRAVEMVSQVRTMYLSSLRATASKNGLITDKIPESDSSHPSVEDRIQAIKTLVREKTAPDQVTMATHLLEYFDQLSKSLNFFVLDIIKDSLIG